MVPFPAAWRLVLLWARPVFAAAGLASGLLLSPRSTPWAVAAAGVYLVFSLLVPLGKRNGGAFALLGRFCHSRRGNDLAGIFINRPNIDEIVFFRMRQGAHDLIAKGADRVVRILRPV